MTQKIANSLPAEQARSIRRAVEQDRAGLVSGFISAAVAPAEREDSLMRLLDELDRELGSVSQEDLAWADKALDWNDPGQHGDRVDPEHGSVAGAGTR